MNTNNSTKKVQLGERRVIEGNRITIPQHIVDKYSIEKGDSINVEIEIEVKRCDKNE
jgi:hypothetical protein